MGIFEPFRRKSYISRSSKTSKSVQRNSHDIPKKRKIDLSKYFQEYSCKWLKFRLPRKHNETNVLSESQKYILHLWRSIARLKPCVNKRKGIHVSKFKNCLFCLI